MHAGFSSNYSAGGCSAQCKEWAVQMEYNMGIGCVCQGLVLYTKTHTYTFKERAAFVIVSK